MTIRQLSTGLLFLALLAGIGSAAVRTHAETTPGTLMYEGRLLNAQRKPITGPVQVRFSLWSSANWTASDETPSGGIATGAANYGGWFETQTITPTSNGIVSLRVGAGTPLPELDVSRHAYLQVEIKPPWVADTEYQLLDPTGDNGSDERDRTQLSSVPYAKNAESVRNRKPGTQSGNLVILGPGGRLQPGQMSSGTTLQNFILNMGNAAGDVSLTFGTTLLPVTLKYSQAKGQFEFSDDVYVKGNLAVTGILSGTLLTLSHLRNCDSIDTNGSGTLMCGSDAGNGEHNVTSTLTPEFDKATYQADGADNVGQLSMVPDGVSKKNMYVWTSTRPTLQDYDLFVRVQVPTGFVRWKTDGGQSPIVVHYRSTSGDAANNALDFSVIDTAGNPVGLSGVATGLASATWATTAIGFTGTPVWTAGQEFILKLHVSAKNAAQMHIGSIELRMVAVN